MDFNQVFDDLREVLVPYSSSLIVKTDEPGMIFLDTHYQMKNKKPLFFGSVEIKKNYVSFHLMPVYVSPALLDDISPDLRKRMQGKSCFNFNKVDQSLFSELATLTRKGFDYYQEQGYISK